MRALRILAACVAVAATGCISSQRVPRMRYYTLAPPASAAAVPVAVETGRFTADPPYDTARIAYRTSPYRLDYYVYHRWAADPARLVAMAARDYFAPAATRDGAVPFVVDGHVRRLEEVDRPDGWHGVLALDVTVRRGDAVVLERRFAETERAEERTPEAVAAALSRALGRALDTIAESLARIAPRPSP
jgi:ABC-type uncharacterized transport system auxiliary subunit